ncbi:MAG: HdeD family acid-resistance protein [Nocardiopsaceae bacterium]|nr:HdeD family acid-resistance protein [Nocardiopsaceae bacterium]
MLDYLARHWWYLAARGALAIVFGLIVLFWPGIPLAALAAVFGVYALADGAFTGVMAFHAEPASDDPERIPWLGMAEIRASEGQRMPLVIEAVFGVFFGLVALAWAGASLLLLTVVVGAWAVGRGVFQIITALRLRSDITGEWLYILTGALSVCFGLLIWFAPIAGPVNLAFILGVYTVLFGAALVALSLRVRRVGRSRGIDS